MAENPPQVFTGISLEQFKRIEAKAQANGMDISGNSGAASQFGVEISWNYLPEREELTIHCLKVPFIIKHSDVTSRIDKLIASTAS